MAKLRAVLEESGLTIQYDADLAALDVGLHLYERSSDPGTYVSQTRVWFQAKGRRTAKVPKEQFESSETISVKGISVEHLRYWYAAPEPV